MEVEKKENLFDFHREERKRPLNRRTRKLSKRKKIVFGLILLLFAIRILYPAWLLNRVNTFLGSFSVLYQMQIEDMELHLFRMAYSFTGVTGKLKKNSAQFMQIQRVDVALAWRELFRGRMVADVDVTQAKLLVTTATLRALSGQSPGRIEADAQQVKDKTIPFDLERLHCVDSQFEFSDLQGLPPEQNLSLTHIELIANNLTPSGKKDLSMVTATGDLQGTARIQWVGQLRLNQTPVEWSVNTEMKNFELSQLNPVAVRMVPLSFKKGSLSLFGAVRSVNGEVHGYFKPFLKSVVLMGDPSDFKNIFHFFYELVGTLGNFFLKNPKTKALATRVNFHTVKGKVKFDTQKALSTAIKNGFGSRLIPALDETLELE